jgi:endonuclease/exonuclease/phosphatase family metal-dependent hydrolase
MWNWYFEHHGLRSSRRSRTRVAAGGFAVVAGAALVLAPVSATAYTAQRAGGHHHHHGHSHHTVKPRAPRRLKVVHVTRTSFTVRVNAKAQRYRLYASTNEKHLYVKYIKGAQRTRKLKQPTLTIHGLHYSAKPYWFRVEAINGQRRTFSNAIGSVGLTPTTPTHLTATANLHGLSLNWDSAPATGFMVTEATDPAMTENIKSYSVENQDHTFSPPDLDPGTPYYFQVSALNQLTPSAPTPAVQTMALTQQQPLKIMTYNLLELTADGQMKGGSRVAPWPQRRTAQVGLIKSAMPDAIAIQEGAKFVAADRGPRQVDDLVSHLGPPYSLATTELPPSQPHYHRTGVYIVYNSSQYATTAEGGHWELGNTRWAAYQILQNKSTGAKFLFVAPHLIVASAGGTDAQRAAETHSLLAQAGAYDQQHGNIPIVFAGDFNSDPGHKVNAPSVYLLAHGYNDSYDVATSRSHADYNSANGYQRTPPKQHMRLDYVFTEAGIAVKSWALLMNLAHGQFTGVIPSDHSPIVTNLQLPYLGAS